MTTTANPDLLTPAEAEAYTRIPKPHLAQLRYTGKGPKFLKPSPRVVLYRRADLDEWLEASARTITGGEAA